MTPPAPRAPLGLRLARLEAEAAIIALKHRYWRAIDRGARAEAASCLTPGCSVEFPGMPPMPGRAAFLAAITQAAAAAPPIGVHHGHNPVITLAEDGRIASGIWDVWYQGLDPARFTRLAFAGEYQDSYSLERGVWLIAGMRMCITSME